MSPGDIACDWSRGRSTTAQSGSEYGSADESTALPTPHKEKETGEGGNEFAISVPVRDRAGPLCSKDCKRRGSGASVASSSEAAPMEVDLTECDPTSKRAREDDDAASMHSEPANPPSRGKKSSRGRGRATGQYVGLAEAQANKNRLEDEELMLRAERELLDSWTGEPKVTRARKVLLGVGVEARGPSEEGPEETLDPSSLSAAELSGQLQKSVEALYTVASFKKGYKGTHIKVLREAAGVVSAVGTELLSDESRRLREYNVRLSDEVEELRRQLDELKGRVASMADPKGFVPPSSPTDSTPMEVISSSPPRRNKPFLWRLIRGLQRSRRNRSPLQPLKERAAVVEGERGTAQTLLLLLPVCHP